MNDRLCKLGYTWYANTMDQDKGLAGLQAMYDVSKVYIAKVNDTYSIWYYGKKKKL